MSRQIVITLPEWTEIKGIDNKQFAELLPAYDEMLNMIKNGKPLDDVLDKIKAEIKQLPYQRIFGNVSSYSLLDTVVEIIDKYRKSEE